MSKIAGLIVAYEILGTTRGACSALMVQAGFKSADETANAGHLLGAGGLVLGAADVVQGIGKFQEAEGIAEAIQIRNNQLEALDKKALDQDISLEIEAIDEPCSVLPHVNDEITLEIEEDVLCDGEALSNKQAKVKDQTEEQIKEVKDLEQDEINTFDDVEKNKRIKLVNKDYEVRADKIKNNAAKFQTVGTPGQATYYVAQGLSEHQKAKSQKESLIQQVQQDNQQQQANTADGIKREIDKLADFDPFQRNSSSQR